MSQGWDQGGGQQGGYPQQQGGYPQQQGGYPQQQGGGYGPPPGQGYGPPPGQGYGPPPGQGQGAPPGGAWPGAQGGGPSGGGGGASGGFGRFMPGIVVGGVISGILSMIPLLNMLNCCFCLLNIAGVLGGMAMHLHRAPDDKLSMGEAAGFGAAAGAVGGALMSVGGFILNLALGALLADLYRSISPQLAAQMGASAAAGLLAIPIYVVLFAGFGALAGVLGISVFWKGRQAGKS